jgi:hypothetical protein
MTASTRKYAVDIDQVALDALAALQRRGMFLISDKVLPNLVIQVVGAPVTGSWWAHPLCHEIYMVSQRLRDHADVAVLKLVNGKNTFVHRTRWPELCAIGSGNDAWQMFGLPAGAKKLLARVGEAGSLRIDELRSGQSMKELGQEARLLEARLLVFGDDVHTDSGAHVKRIETWPHWAARVSFSPEERMSSAQARASFEAIADSWREEFGGKVWLPWPQSDPKSLPNRPAGGSTQQT